MSGKDKLEVVKCHHCCHEWEPRVKKPKKCPQCQNSLWKSPSPKKLKVPKAPVDVLAAQTLTAQSEEAASTPPITDTNIEATPPAVSGAVVEKLEPIYTRVEMTEPESVVARLQREADERLRRLAHDPID